MLFAVLTLWSGLQLLLLALVVAACGSIILSSLRLGISPMPSSPRAKAAVLKLLERHLDLQAPFRIAELGAGWGTLAIPIARRFPAATLDAYEASFLPWLWLKLCPSPPNMTLHRADFFQQSLEDTDVFVCYLFTGAMRRLATKLAQEAPRHALLITHTFSLPGWTPAQTIVLDDLYKTHVYAYKLSDQMNLTQTKGASA